MIPIGQINVQVLIFTRNPKFKLLLLKRVPERNGYWQPVSGGIEKCEKPIDTIKREIFEETGIRDLEKIIDLDYNFIFTIEWHGRLTKMKEICFAAETRTAKVIKLSNEHEEYKWCTENEAKQLLNWNHNQIALNKLLKLTAAENKK